VKRTVFILTSGFWILASGFSHAILDTNNNGVSDFWERDVHNGSLFDGYFDLQGDTDADGWTNAQEAAAGTNPFDPNPPDGMIRPDIIHTPAVWGEENGVPFIDTPEAVTVTWPTIHGKRYRLLVSADLSQGSWLGVPDSDFISNGNIPEFHFTTSESDKLFWRVTVEDIDWDGDGLNDYEEHKFGSNPASPMTHPGIPDAWLAANFTSAQGFDPNGDPDGDGLTNTLENRLGTDPNNPDIIGMVNPGFGEVITDSPDMTFRDNYPSDLYDQSSVEGWEANGGQHIEIWDEGDDNPYAELQSHLGAHGIKQEFDMIPGTRLNFILRYKGRYDFDAYDNEFKLEVQGASEMLVDGAPAEELDGTRKHSFMDDDESEKYVDWHYVSVSITAETGGTGLKQLTLKLVPKTTTTYGDDGEQDITYGGFVDILPIEVVAVFGFGGEPGKATTKAYLESAATFKSGNLYMVKGEDPEGAEKSYAVLLGESQADLQQGLSKASCFVVFDGHSNMGMGPSFVPANIKRLSDFMNIGNSQAAINWPFFVQDEYPGLTTIEANEIAGTVTNYEVPNLAITDKLRYPNTDGVGAGGTFTKTGTGMGQKHFNRGADNHCLIVNGGSADLLALAYDSFFYNSCNTGRDYIEVFTKGTFFYTGATCSDGESSREYVKAIIDGKRGAEVLQAVNAEENVNHMISR
jgi:hypothetical protein